MDGVKEETHIQASFVTPRIYINRFSIVDEKCDLFSLIFFFNIVFLQMKHNLPMVKLSITYLKLC